MALFIPGSTTCAISGRTLYAADEVVTFPVFETRHTELRRFSDAVVDFAFLRLQSNFQDVVKLFGSLPVRGTIEFRNADGVIVSRRLEQGFVTFSPLLISFNAPMSSIVRLVNSGLVDDGMHGRLARLEFDGVSCECDGASLVVKMSPTKYRPSEAPANLVQTVNRRASTEVHGFLKFLRAARTAVRE